MPTLVSILSNHTIPNFLFIKEAGATYDKNIFIITDDVKKLGRDIALEKTLGYKTDSIRRIHLTSADNYFKIMEELSAEKFDDSDEYCVNQTGGTKVMSIAAFNYFSKRNARFVYVPIGANKYYEFDKAQEHDLNYRWSLKEYFSLYGITCKSDNQTVKTFAELNAIFVQIQNRNYKLKNNMTHAQDLPTAEERAYWSGQWFEEYIYLRIKRDYHLPDNAIAKSVQIFRDDTQNDNELDVVFVKDNALTVIECKVTMYGVGGARETTEEYLYKLAAISKDFGLKVNPYLFTLHKMEKISGNFDKRIKILGIKGIYDGKRIAELDLKL